MSEEKKKKPLKERIGENIVQFFSFSAIIVLVVFLSISQKTFLSPMNLSNLFRDTSTLIVLASGMFMVLLFGSIDLSMGAACSVSNVLYVKFLLTYGPKFIPAAAGVIGLLISLMFGVVAGGLLGFIHVSAVLYRIPGIHVCMAVNGAAHYRESGIHSESHVGSGELV